MTALLGIGWYLWGAFLPAEDDPGREYMAAPIYMLVIAIVLSVVAWIGCIIARARSTR